MPFFIETYDKDELQHLRAAHRAEHLAYLEANKHLIIAGGGKLVDDGSRAVGSVLLVAVETREEAEKFIQDDPFFKAGLFEKTVINRWRKSFFDGKRCQN